MSTAIFIDGDFFLRRYYSMFGPKDAREVAIGLHNMCLKHMEQKDGQRTLYRIFFYDCPPMTKTAFHPISQRAIDFSRTPTANWRNELHQQLRKLRKVALRLGYLNDRQAQWTIRPEQLQNLLERRITVEDMREEDVYLHAPQKGVDMRIGLDIATLTFKRLVDQIILVAGDSDFVPAAKLARREGVDVILDPMWSRIREDLYEHIDGLWSVLPRPAQAQSEEQTSH